jgi:hypothetical protein
VRRKCGSLVVFLSDLPAQLTVRDLKDLIREEIRSAPPRRLHLGTRICECSILRITDLNRGTVEYHGLVEIRPPRLAIQVIDRLDGKLLGGQRISVRRYRQRSPLGHTGPGTAAGTEGDDVAPDLVERRRTNLRIELADTERDIFGRITSPLQWSRWFRPDKQDAPDPTAP